jgi:hypothetical protein
VGRRRIKQRQQHKHEKHIKKLEDVVGLHTSSSKVETAVKFEMKKAIACHQKQDH